MRLTYFIACAIAAIDTVEKAAGMSPSTLFAPDYVWVYWPLAVLWLAFGLYAFVWDGR